MGEASNPYLVVQLTNGLRTAHVDELKLQFTNDGVPQEFAVHGS